jgi:hypothetical protein
MVSEQKIMSSNLVLVIHVISIKYSRDGPHLLKVSLSPHVK